MVESAAWRPDLPRIRDRAKVMRYQRWINRRMRVWYGYRFVNERTEGTDIVVDVFTKDGVRVGTKCLTAPILKHLYDGMLEQEGQGWLSL